MQDRIDTLQRISGLEVTYHKERKDGCVGESVYTFKRDGQTIKSCFTYDKAKLFAEGVAYGKSLTVPSEGVG